MPYGGTQDIVTTVGTPGTDSAVPSEQAVREALAAVVGGASAIANLLDNPEFAIDQRGGGAARDVLVGAYTMDRWYALHPAASQTVEQIDAGLSTSTFAGRLTIAAPQVYGGLAQIVEGVKSRPCRGRAMQLQARVRFDSATTLYYAVLEWTGTVDTVTNNVVNDWGNASKTVGQFFAGSDLIVAATGTQAVAANTWTALAGSGTISSSCNNLIVFVWAETAGVLDITEADLFAGDTSRIWAPKDPAADLMECYRHCYVFQATRENGYRQGTTQVVALFLQFPIQMRMQPSPSHNITDWSNTWSPVATTVGFYNAVTIASATITGTLSTTITAYDGLQWGVTFTAGTSFSGNAGNIGAIGFGSDVRIVFSADL